MVTRYSVHPCVISEVERVMGFEPTTSCLGSRRSATELHPRARSIIAHGDVSGSLGGRPLGAQAASAMAPAGCSTVEGYSA